MLGRVYRWKKWQESWNSKDSRNNVWMMGILVMFHGRKITDSKVIKLAGTMGTEEILYTS